MGESDSYAGAIGRPDRDARIVAPASVRAGRGWRAKGIVCPVIPGVMSLGQTGPRFISR
jgi:hypothetical protein